MNVVKLGDICDFFNGGAWTQSEFTETGYPVLKVSNCKNSGFEIDDVSFIPYEIAQKSENNKLYIGDVIIATVGSHPNLVESAAGRSCIVTQKVQGFYLNQNAVCLRSKDCDVLDQRYLGYLAASAPFKHYIQSRGKGAANQMRIAIGAIKEYEFLLPEIKIQRKIGATLAAYDDLIENNQKQIKLLEEAAQRLYKEWFVDLRFPGYENTPIVDGIPSGWKTAEIADFGEIVTGKTPSTAKAEYYGGNIPFVKIPDMHNNVFPITTEISLTKEGAETQKNKYIPRNSLMVSCIATVGLVNIAVVECQTNQQINSIILQNERDLYFLYFTLKQMKSLLDGVGSNGATMTNVNKAKFGRIPVVCPAEELRKAFYEWCEPVFREIENLSKNIILLQEARDSLLPKLMSGEIEV